MQYYSVDFTDPSMPRIRPWMETDITAPRTYREAVDQVLISVKARIDTLTRYVQSLTEGE